MAISKELKLGVIAIATILMMVWGYTFLKGQKLFATSVTLYSTFDDVYQLAVSSPVYINGLKVGSVSSITVNPDNVKEMTVGYYIEGEYGIPKTAVTKMITEGIVGGKALAIEYDHMCNTDCVENGDVLDAKIEGLLETMMPKDQLNDYVGEIKTVLTQSMGKDSTTMVNKLTQDLNATLHNLSSITKSLDQLLATSSKHLSGTMRNVEGITKNLAANDEKINGILSNLEQVSKDLESANISELTTNANKAIVTTDATIASFKTTAEKSNEAVAQLTDLLNEMKSGEGSMAKLINDGQLYTNLEETSANLSLLLQDLRLNPKRYVNISVFGKKDKDYVKPENDPAFEED